MKAHKNQQIKKAFWVLWLLSVLIITGCQNFKGNVVFPVPFGATIISHLLDTTRRPGSLIVNPLTVNKFYYSSHYIPAWSVRGSLLPAADSLIQFIRSVDQFGLYADDYHEDEIRSHLISTEGQSIYELDILLSDSFFSLWNHLHFGRLDPNRHAEDDSIKIIALQEGLVLNSINSILMARQPLHKEYYQLKASLEKLLKMQDQDSLDVRNTISTLQINMERWRQEPYPMPERYVLVNVPAYTLSVVDSDQLILESKVIVGKPETPTYSLSGQIDCFTLYPYWFVPRKIAIEEILKEIKRDSTYIIRHNLDVLDRKGGLLDPDKLDWQSFNQNNFPVVLRQREGPENSLGVIKFHFNNPYAIYLHDTNTKKLFRESKRALSHGCVRVENAYALAVYLVKDDSVFNAPDILKKYIERKQRLEINLIEPIPILIRYFTAEVTDDSLRLYEDIYKLDTWLQHRLETPVPPL